MTRPGELYWSVIEPYWFALNDAWSEDATTLLGLLQTVPARVRHLYSAHWCVSEVDNGGLYQFFHNTTGILAPESVEAFDAIGLEQCAIAVRDAMGFFGSPYPRSRRVRLGRLPEGEGKARLDWDPFEKQDNRFYACTSQEPNGWESAADRYASGS